MEKKKIKEYTNYLINNQLSENTIKKYKRESEELESYLKNKKPTKENIISYLEILQKKQYKKTTLNNKIICINKYIKYISKDPDNKKGLTLKPIKTQAREIPNAITQQEYDRIMKQAKTKGTPRDVIMLQLFLNTGIRVSELKFFTVESLKKGYMEIKNKGKYRIVPLAKKLIKQGKEYAKKNNINQGSIIISNQKTPISRATVFRRLKYLGGQARIKKSKLHPHSIRHLFAKNYLHDNKDDILRLADILGHESLETTRIYTKLDTDELRKTIKYRG
ncbi:tyrosine-type recombinase/integrase [Anaerococcus hydrogenalis]|uniref:Integrase n=1 Tax=Anaerococcus hydrogenalis TaxID=33029 RepID=A0A2N6UL12_9FIRM|nr:tyrosine-type recombinase/integrase [Anaerococcus hydrogenalis]MDK7694465.1 tyrosine-type recombinase/integrase [Anaerococcus hydrogenalis]MDK7696243.1 tyrosine-type recombinase/integrase [Anaerococcus hydrogenalis]MDK7707492.1 tyrosine-type recombinase/integrase [Anaerococcus hydrogenalis]PMC82505.1 integrase [Anaerococcus hydrogenalis]